MLQAQEFIQMAVGVGQEGQFAVCLPRLCPPYPSPPKPKILMVMGGLGQKQWVWSVGGRSSLQHGQQLEDLDEETAG